MPHAEYLVPGLICLVIGVGLITLARFWPQRRPAVTAVAPVETMPLRAAGELTGPVIAVTRAITWPAHVDPDPGELDAAERRRVLEGLGLVGDAWSAQILTQAFDEEHDDLRVAAIEALAMCTGDDVAPTLERAYASYAVPERYAAIDGASRRGDVALLERGLRDTDGTVALAAAYGLTRAERSDLVDAGLAGRDDARANEIRRLLAILT